MTTWGDPISHLTDTQPLSLTIQCIMITGDNPLTAVHVAKEVEIVDRECLVLDVRENSTDEKGAFAYPNSASTPFIDL
jgi:magnesium-transporting ATPase (P-type)